MNKTRNKIGTPWMVIFRQKKLLAIILVIVLFISLVWFYTHLQNDSFFERVTRTNELLVLYSSSTPIPSPSTTQIKSQSTRYLDLRTSPSPTINTMTPPSISTTMSLGTLPPKHSKHYLLVVAVMSYNRSRRHAIRATWKNGHYTEPRYDDVVVKFIVGTLGMNSTELSELEEEEAHYHDIVFLPNLRESYSNLTRKVLYTMEWIDRHMDYSYVLKCDEDSFVLVDRIAHDLHQRGEDKKRLYWGFFIGNAWLKREGPWAEVDWFLCDLYLPYAFGGGYVLSQDVVHAIVLNAANIVLHASEDVSVGVWTAPYDIERKHDNRFDSEALSRGCANDFLLTHKQSIEDMHDKHNRLRTKKILCKKQFLYKSYKYKWNSRPSKCCKIVRRHRF